jgi:hydrogenase nickel incorporation protein HypA/HybF
MHELRIAEDLSGIVLEAAMNEKLEKVTKVNIAFGELVQIVPDIFETAFMESVRGTLAEGSKLDIEIVKIRMKCKNCGKEFRISGNIFACRYCRSTDLEIVNGKEIFIKSIEGE